MFSIFTKLSWFFKKEWRRYTIAVALLLVANVVEVTPPWLVGQAIDAMFQGEMTTEILIQLAGGLFLIACITYGITYYWQYLLFGGAYHVERTLRSRFMDHMLKMTPTFFERFRTGDLMARSTNDLKAISTTAGFGILTLIDSTTYMLTILLTMGFLVSWELTLAAVLPLPVLAIVMQWLGKKIHARYTAAQDAFGDLNDRVLESIAGVRVIRAYVQEREDEANFYRNTEDVYKKNMKVAFIDSLFNPLTKIITGVSYMIGLGYGAYLVFQSAITLGNLVTFNIYLGMLIWPMFAIGELINVMQRGNASLDRVNETLSYEEDVKDPKSPATVQMGTIRFDRVGFRYPSSSVENLKSLSFSVPAGSTIGIVGKTGSGKTTIIKQLLREYPSGDGTISIGGIPLDQLTKDDLRSLIGYVPQDHVLFSKSVRENIEFALSGPSDDQLDYAIKMAHFEQDLERLPEGLRTLVGEKGVALSGGQKQRISIARALLQNPEVLLLDDALSAVDAKTEAKIIENIRRERRGKTTFITTHRLSAIEHADHIIVLEDGLVVQEGTHEDLVAQPGWYAEQFERQQVASGNEEVRV